MALQKYVQEDQIVRNPDTFYKKGITKSPDAEARFSPEYHEKYNFKFEPLGRDYKVRCVWSAYLPYKKAKQIEKEWETEFPKNIWLDTQYNGVTECRYLTHDEYKRVLNECRDKYPKKDYGWKLNYWKVYFVEFTKK